MACAKLSRREKSLNNTISEMVEYRWKLRQSCEALLKYAEDVFPWPSRSGDERADEEEARRKKIVKEAKEILYNTAKGDSDGVRSEGAGKKGE